MGKHNRISPLIKREEGNTYGYWKVLNFAGREKWGGIQWRCRCICGKEQVVGGRCLRAGESKSCGCKKSEMLSDAHLRKTVCPVAILIRKKRKQQGFNRRNFAKAAGVSLVTANRLESGGNLEHTTVGRLKKVLTALGLQLKIVEKEQ